MVSLKDPSDFDNLRSAPADVAKGIAAMVVMARSQPHGGSWHHAFRLAALHHRWVLGGIPFPAPNAASFQVAAGLIFHSAGPGERPAPIGFATRPYAQLLLLHPRSREYCHKSQDFELLSTLLTRSRVPS